MLTRRRNRDALVDELARARARVRKIESALAELGGHGPQPPPDRYRALFENSADAILIIDGDTFVDCNQATVDMLRYDDKQQLLETHPSELSPPCQPDGRDSYEKANEMIRIAFEQGSHRFEWMHKRADGEVFPVEVLLTPLPGPDRTRLHVVWRDITDRKELESQLRQAQKMEAMGRLAGGIAHDFNNLLTIINGNAEKALRALAPTDDLSESLKRILWAGERAAELTNRLLTSSRRNVPQSTVLDLNEVTQRAHELLHRLLGENIVIRTVTTPAPLTFKADPGLIEQAIINLANNARDAMPDGGAVTLEVAEEVVVDRASSPGVSLDPGRYARLTVSDTGVGMDEATKEQAFEPFFTTKDVGKGSGLGLSMVYGIIRQSDGQIVIDSTPGAGTRVTIWFPAVDDAVAAPHSHSNPPRGGDETILVVEDDAGVAAVIEEILLDAGFTVLTCSNGAEALDRFTRQRGAIDLILSDVVMPQMGGPELVQRLKGLGKIPPVVFVSGYTDELLSSVDELGLDVSFLQKPFNRHNLLLTIRSALDERRLRQG